MTNRERMDKMLNNLNEEGLSIILKAFKDMDKCEKYNINTSPERLEELKRIEEQKKEQEEIDQKEELYRRAQANYARQKTYKAELTGKEKKFFEKIESVTLNERYCMEYWEMMLLVEVYNNNLLNGSLDIFRYGFMKGQRAERAKIKQKNKVFVMNSKTSYLLQQ